MVNKRFRLFVGPSTLLFHSTLMNVEPKQPSFVEEPACWGHLFFGLHVSLQKAVKCPFVGSAKEAGAEEGAGQVLGAGMQRQQCAPCRICQPCFVVSPKVA